MPSLSQDEIAKYWDMFQMQNPVNSLLSGEKMFALLKNSKLEDKKLEKIWDLSDIDEDGNMDFEEFCIAMRLVFDVLNGSMPSVPSSLPSWLVPKSKEHLVTAKQALAKGQGQQSQDPGADYDEDMSLSSNFSWYLSPNDRKTYETVYFANADSLGYVSYDSLGELYPTLNTPETDITSAWNLVNPRSDEKIDKEQCMVYLHILNQRSNGVRVPRSVPASLRATFGKQQPSYDIASKQAEIKSSQTPVKKSGFAEGYLSRLGLGGKQGFSTSGTDFSATKDTDWEEVRLQRELSDLKTTLSNLEASKKDKTTKGSSDALVRRELQLLLEYKEDQVRQSSKGPDSHDAASVARTKDEIDMIGEQVDALKDHLQARQRELEQLQNEISAI